MNSISPEYFINKCKLIVAYWRHMVSCILVNINWGNDVLPDNTKSLSQSMLTYYVAVTQSIEFYQNTNISIQVNAYKNAVYKWRLIFQVSMY